MRMLFRHPFEHVELGSAIHSVKEELASREVDRTSDRSLIGAINSTIEYESKLLYSRLLKALELAQRLGVPSTVEVRKTAGWVLLICSLSALGYGSTPVESPRFLALLLVLVPVFTWVLTGNSEYRSVGADLGVASGAGLFLGLVAARVVRPDDHALRNLIVGVWFIGFLFTMLQVQPLRQSIRGERFRGVKARSRETKRFRRANPLRVRASRRRTGGEGARTVP